MAAGAQERAWNGPSRRHGSRFVVRAPMDVTVLRSGIPDTLPGRSVNLSERGLAAILAGDLLPGETVGVEIRLPMAADSLRTRALVRHQENVCCGMEFLSLSPEQQAGIRHWAELSKAKIAPESPGPLVNEAPDPAVATPDLSGPADSRLHNRKARQRIWVPLLAITALLAAILWWRWNRSWEQLESGQPNYAAISADQPRVQVPAEVMQKLLIHKVEPDFTVGRRAHLQGIIVLEIVVGRDGSVIGMHAVNGPDVLARSAMGAVRSWKFEPYRVNGEPAIIGTTVAVEFRP